MSSQVPPPQDPEDRGSEPPGGARWSETGGATEPTQREEDRFGSSHHEDAWRESPADPAHTDYQPSGWGEDRAVGIRPASVGKRVGAFIIDWIGISIVVVIIAIPIGITRAVTGGDTTGFGYGFNLLSSAALLAYFVLMEANGGRTLAKMMMGITAVKADGGPLDLEAAFKRNFWWVIGSLIPIVGWLVSLGIFIYALVSTTQDQPLHRGFHDKFANSMVVESR